MAQVAAKEAINTFSEGMNMDLDVGSIKQSQYRYAENVRITNSDNSAFGALSPIENDQLIPYVTFNGEYIVASESIRNYVAVFTEEGIIYRLKYEDGILKGKSQIFHNTAGFKRTLSTVARYDNENSIRVYFAEDGSPIRSINISEDADGYNTMLQSNRGVDGLNIIPSELLNRPVISNIGVGRLNAGKIQYAYSLYSKYGSETELSPLSESVNIFASGISDKSSDILGTDKDIIYGKPAGKSVSILIGGIDTSIYSNIKIYSIYYVSSADIPFIRLIADFPVSSPSVSYTDSGSAYLEEYSVEEFNTLRSFKISAARIESKDATNASASGSILFAADVKEIVSEFEDYDVRAYQFTSGGGGVLKDSRGGQLTISSNNISLVPKDHDCINDDIYKKYKYSDITQKYDLSGNYGGEGPNVRFLFTNTYLIESYGNYRGGGIETELSQADRYIDQRIPRIGDIKRNITDLLLNSSDGSHEKISVSSLGILPHEGYLNYADPLIASKLASYQRDEIYRFGAVLYDNNGNKSDVKWIADIRFPSNYISKDSSQSSWNASSVEAPIEVYSSSYTVYGSESNATLSKQELLVKPLGLKFEFKNIPPSISRIEIVRSKRDLTNRTVYAQGVLQKTGTKFKELMHNNEELPGAQAGSAMPHPLISMAYLYSAAAPVDAFGSGAPTQSSESRYSMFAHANTGMSYYGESTTSDGRNADKYNYTDHGLSPYHWNKNLYLFVNPESSFYKSQFVDSISSASGSLKLCIEDISYPLSTPVRANMSQSSYGEYYLDGWNNNFAVQYVTGAGWMPTMMHFAANISDYMLNEIEKTGSSANIPTVGLVGTHKLVIASNVAGESAKVTNDTINNLSSISDISNLKSGSYYEPGVRAFISTGKRIFESSPGNYRYDNCGPSYHTPIALADQANKSAVNFGTFKYFGRYSAAPSTDRSISLIKQSGSSVALQSDVYSVSKVSDIDPVDISSTAYSGNINQGVRIEDASNEYVAIDGSLYLNWSKSILRGDSVAKSSGDSYKFVNQAVKARLSGVHGDGLLISVRDEHVLPSISRLSIYRKKYDGVNSIDSKQHIYLDAHGTSALSTYVANLKSMSGSIYGGNSYQDRKFSEYITTGSILTKSGTSASSYVFGGDTYIGIFDYTIIRSTDPDPNSEILDTQNIRNVQYSQTGSVGAMIPIESSINMRMQSGKSYVISKNPFIQSNPGIHGPGISGGALFTRSQSLPEFEYNSAYSADKTGRVYLIKIDDTIISLDYRVYASDKKTTLDKFDSWAIFRPANYIDVDSRFGPITRLKTFGNKLFFWQNDAFGVLSVNERSLIQDGNTSQLVLGTGDVLSRYDYISTSYGLNKGAVGALSVSDIGMYWLDHKRAEIAIYSSQVASVAKAKGIQGLLNSSKSKLWHNIPFGYDKKYNELVINLNGINGEIETDPIIPDDPTPPTPPTPSQNVVATEILEPITTNNNEEMLVS